MRFGGHVSRPTLALLAPQGWSLRNWVLTDFLRVVTRHANVVVFSPEAHLLAEHFDEPAVSFAHLEVHALRPWRQALARSIDLGHYNRQSTFIHRYMLTRRASGRSWRSRLAGAGKKALGKYIFQYLPPGVLEGVEQMGFGLRAEMRRLEGEFRRRGVDFVLSTVPLIAHYERPALWAAQRVGIPTACIITSWDNLYSKGRLPVRFHRHLVWSPLMRDTLLAHYPRMSAEAVEVVGPPQFDFYRRPDLVVDRGEFLRSLGADPSRRVILWSGASMNQMPNEAALVARFCEETDQGRSLGNAQILVRPHPIGGGAPFAEVVRRFPEVVLTETNATDPRHLIHWTPLERDVAELVNTLTHSDVIINHCSTMTLDGCAVDTPVVNLAFDVESGSEMEQYVRYVYGYDHYRTVLEAGAVRMANDMEELVGHVGAYLADPSRDRDGRRRLLQLQCGDVDGRAAERAARVVLQAMGVTGAVTEEVSA